MVTCFMLMEGSLPLSNDQPARLLIVMGVAGSGKSTIGEGLAKTLGTTYMDGDDYHPPANIKKMSAGEPLTDEDRWPWLERFSKELSKARGQIVGGCSSLKRTYREAITRHCGEPVLFIYLHGSKELIAERMGSRTGHFMPTTLIESQFAALEEPQADELTVRVDIGGAPDQIVEDIIVELEKLNETTTKA